MILQLYYTCNIISPVDIEKDQFVGHLKKVIKAEKAPEFNNLPAGYGRHDDQLETPSKVEERKSNKWTANIEHATLEGLRIIYKEYEPPSLEKDEMVLKFISEDKERYSPQNDQDLREILQLFVAKSSFKFTVLIETPLKPFSDWSFPKTLFAIDLLQSTKLLATERKASEIEEGIFVARYSELLPIVVVYDSKNMEGMVERELVGYCIRYKNLIQISEVVKKHGSNGSTSNLAGKLN
ncbi:unnamed protein product [Rhizophagus irregularis]|nr:unnamed protein product [Rhizophagus irregularis]